MNYRHIYHAGNFADVTKHLVLILCLDYLKQKDKPFCVLDAHGGGGLYDLSSIEAEKTGEWKDGIDLFLKFQSANDDIKRVQEFFANDVKHKRYPGSPLIAAKLIRDTDTLLANELHPEDASRLKNTLHAYRNAKVFDMDAYTFLRAQLPPDPRRGLVLIDPPFEKTDEFETLIKQLKEMQKRFETGLYLLWYPIKPHLNVSGLKTAVRELGWSRSFCFETYKHAPETKDVFNGCGLILLNAPFQMPERIEVLAPDLKKSLALHSLQSGWITAE